MGRRTWHRLLRSGSMSLKVLKGTLELFDLSLLLTLAHWLVLLLRGRLGQFCGSIFFLFVLQHRLGFLFNFRSVLHNVTIDLPKTVCANDVNIKLDFSVITFLQDR